MVSSMGQLLTRVQLSALAKRKRNSNSCGDNEEANLDELWLEKYLKKCDQEERTFTDLRNLPPEIGLKVLSNLDADELRKITGIWSDLADDNSLWKRLCYSKWGYCSAYKTPTCEMGPHFWKNIYRKLERSTAFFNCCQGFLGNMPLPEGTFRRNKLIDNCPQEWAEFLFHTDELDPVATAKLLWNRLDILHHYMWKYDFTNVFLPVALRTFFFKLSIRTDMMSHFITCVFQEFTSRYCHCNPEFNQDSLIVVVYALNILSSDLLNPNIRNKMSKREFIKNTLRAVAHLEHPMIDTEYLCHTYDNVYLLGHVAPVRFIPPDNLICYSN